LLLKRPLAATFQEGPTVVELGRSFFIRRFYPRRDFFEAIVSAGEIAATGAFALDGASEEQVGGSSDYSTGIIPNHALYQAKLRPGDIVRDH
jgi:hypothetical protein